MSIRPQVEAQRCAIQWVAAQPPFGVASARPSLGKQRVQAPPSPCGLILRLRPQADVVAVCSGEDRAMFSTVGLPRQQRRHDPGALVVGSGSTVAQVLT